MLTNVYQYVGYSRTISLSLVTVVLTACALSVMNVSQSSVLLDDLTVSTKEEEDHRIKAKVSQWRDQSEVRAWMRVEELKGQYGGSKTAYAKAYWGNSLEATANASKLPGGFGQYDVLKRDAVTNGLGEIEFASLKHSDRECVYALQYYGVTTPNYENFRESLGSSRIQFWYCAKTLTSEDIDSLMQGLSI